MNSTTGTTYKIIRFFREDDRPSKVIKTGLTLQAAQDHCKNPTTRREINGEVVYFDGFTEEGR